MNHRSVVLYGRLREVTDPAERADALDAVVERLVPGRAALLRPPTRRELAATTVLALPIDEASAKVRVGGPDDEDGDESWPVWAGVVPICMVAGEPVPAADLPEDAGPAPELGDRAAAAGRPPRN